MIDYNYHTHTYRCGHAFGTEREYIEAAIAHGIKVLGFSDHILFCFGDEDSKSKFEDYVKTINNLKEEYKDKIEIFLGFECEHLPERVSYYNYLLKEKGIDYLLLGQHFIYNKEGKVVDLSKNRPSSKYIAKRYYKALKEALKTGLYKYIAHPDLYTIYYKTIDKSYYRYAKKICKLAKKYDIPLEINLNGLNNKITRHIVTPMYPYEDFFEIAGRIGNKIIVGVDAHCADILLNGGYDYAEELINKYHLNHVTRVNMKK